MSLKVPLSGVVGSAFPYFNSSYVLCLFEYCLSSYPFFQTSPYSLFFCENILKPYSLPPSTSRFGWVPPEIFVLICHQCSTLKWHKSVRRVLGLECLSYSHHCIISVFKITVTNNGLISFFGTLPSLTTNI